MAFPPADLQRRQATEFRVPHSRTALMFWRAVYCALLCVWLANRARLDYELERTWEIARATWWFKHDSFEPVLATLAFGSWILAWRMADMLCPFLHQWRIDATPPEPAKQGALEFILRPGIGYCAAGAYLLPLLVFDQLYPRRSLPERSLRYAVFTPALLTMAVVHPAACRQRSGHLLTSANALRRNSSLDLLCSVVASVAVYDFIFYWVHLALHKVPWLLRNVHAVHHRQVQLSAREVVHHSLSDGVLQVGANVLALKLLGLHPLARAAHNVVVTYLLTESHAGYDMPWMLHNVVPCGILGGPPRHEAHHKYGTLHYHQVRDCFSHPFASRDAR
jgi:sterol desaturase/sphingolipid hydroxylase (fatty acid hydroxylase superfamily)